MAFGQHGDHMKIRDGRKEALQGETQDGFTLQFKELFGGGSTHAGAHSTGRNH